MVTDDIHCHAVLDRLCFRNMLTRTFIHIPGVGPKTESQFWEHGVDDWTDFGDGTSLKLSAAKRTIIRRELAESRRQLAQGNPRFFEHRLPASQHWRLFPDFRGRTAYLDIETTGLDAHATISTIAVYDGSAMKTYVQGRNLEHFIDDIAAYDVLVTYNGKCFDVPVIERTFGRRLSHAHIDLRYVLASLGFKGGLKQCEAQLGLQRDGMQDIDGLFAVVLWKAYRRTRDDQALETLLAYNLQDAINLESLMVEAFNGKVAQTPFDRRCRLPQPSLPTNPHAVHSQVIDRYRREAAFIRSLQPQW